MQITNILLLLLLLIPEGMNIEQLISMVDRFFILYMHRGISKKYNDNDGRHSLNIYAPAKTCVYCILEAKTHVSLDYMQKFFSKR